MNTSDRVRKLSAAGLSPEQIAVVFEILDEEEEERKAKTRARVARWRAGNKPETLSNVTERHVASRNVTDARARVEDNLQTDIPTGQKEDKKPRDDLAAFKAELSDLDADRLEAIIKHRRSRKAQNTAHAARLFRRDAADAGLTLAAAVDTCISRNWITVKAEWLQPRAQRATAPPPERSVSDVLGEIAAGTWQQPDTGPNEPFIETSFTRGN